MLKIAASDISKLFSAISADAVLYAPIEKGNEVEFHPWSEDACVRLDALNTVKSAKDAFFPQSEEFARFKREGKTISVEQAELCSEDTVFFGVKACDARSFQILDKVFLSEPQDSFYAARREHTTVVTMACGKPDDTCFCKVFGIDAAEPEGDVVTWMVGEELYWESKTEKGDALTAKVQALLAEADEASVEAKKAEIRSAVDALPFSDLSLEGFDHEHLNEKFNSTKWAELSKSCLGCGSCTFVCPTCQCYDVREYNTGHGIQRFRCWDSCMYSDFTMMAHGTPRPTQLERFRQRFMHKLVYFPSNNDGQYSCVGCGRCLRKCPINMNIVKVIKAIGGNDNE